ncbi:type I toxin-antitoxin system Fst family toxin [Listeria sp. SHR_NRA_18]|nr:type I toxin-antitoxin system Fst family toxin [Listeria sp. SHR_NRA_18]
MLIFSSIVAPILVGITLVTYKYWLEHRGKSSSYLCTAISHV